MDCLFCSIVKKEKNAKAFYEDDAVLSVLDAMPLANGHALVLPKKHVETILELSTKELGDVFAGVKATVQLLADTLAPDGFTIGINHGKASGQAIDHLHIHIIPRMYNDRGGSLHSIFKEKAPLSPLDEVLEKILAKK